MLTLDTSGLLAALDAADPYHEEAERTLRSRVGPYFVPAGIMTELCYMVERRLGATLLDTLLQDIENGAFALDCGSEDLGRVRRLIRRYADLPLGYADAAVTACAERHGGLVLTYDLRHFLAVGGEGTIRIAGLE